MTLALSLILGLAGGLVWSLLEYYKRCSQPTCPTKRTWVVSALAGLLAGWLTAASGYAGAYPEVFSFIAAYVAADLLNALAMFALERRL